MGRAKTIALTAGGDGQLSLFERFDGFARRAERDDPTRPAVAIFCTVLALMGIGFLMQVSHAATTSSPSEMIEAVWEHGLFRLGGIALMLGAYRIGPTRLRPIIPVLTLGTGLLLIACFLPYIGTNLNGASRWIAIPGTRLTLQPSELARIAIVLWVADRCMRLGAHVRDMRRGVAPMLLLGLTFFFLILIETDVGGALLYLLCFCCTMWVGGARPMHVAGSIVGLGGERSCSRSPRSRTFAAESRCGSATWRTTRSAERSRPCRPETCSDRASVAEYTATPAFPTSNRTTCSR